MVVLIINSRLMSCCYLLLSVTGARSVESLSIRIKDIDLESTLPKYVLEGSLPKQKQIDIFHYKRVERTARKMAKKN